MRHHAGDGYGDSAEQDAGDGYGDSADQLADELLVLSLRLHRQVLRWRATHHPDAAPEELAGMYVSDRDADAVLDRLYASRADAGADEFDRTPLAAITGLLDATARAHRRRERAARAAGVPLRLPMLAERLRLDAFERGVVVLALAPEMDRGYERLFGYLNDDTTFRSPTVALALQLFCTDQRERAAARAAFAPTAALRRSWLVELVEQPAARTLLSRGLRLDAGAADYLLGADGLDPALREAVTAYPSGPPPALDPETARRVHELGRHLAERAGGSPASGGADGLQLVELSGPDVQRQRRTAARLAGLAGRSGPLLVVDGDALADAATAAETVARTLRQACLDGGTPALQLTAVPGDPGGVAASRLFGRGGDPRLRVLLTPEPLPAAAFPDAPLLRLRLPAPDLTERQRLWDAALGSDGARIDTAELADRFRLTSGQIESASRQAGAGAAARGDVVQRADLLDSCRLQAATALPGLAERVESTFGWADLVVPPAVREQLVGIERWIRHRRTVYAEWGLGDRLMAGHGLTALFTGPSGTGKTMAAGILARSLELDLYRIDLSAVVSKYIGETEKNLATIFEAARSASAMLFFDEADALFGKRSEVKDAHDRYANIEVSYLLQRMEGYDGVAILASNFPDNLDRAFARRIHVTVEFPFPQTADRARIWETVLGGDVPRADDVEFGFLARQFALTGGQIRNCALTAAFAAAADGGTVGMRHLVRAVARELVKARQPVVQSSFGPYYDLIRDDGAADRVRA